MTKYDMNVIEQELSKAIAIADLLTKTDVDVIANTVVGAGMILTDILVGIKARVEGEQCD